MSLLTRPLFLFPPFPMAKTGKRTSSKFFLRWLVSRRRIEGREGVHIFSSPRLLLALFCLASFGGGDPSPPFTPSLLLSLLRLRGIAQCGASFNPFFLKVLWGSESTEKHKNVKLTSIFNFSCRFRRKMAPLGPPPSNFSLRVSVLRLSRTKIGTFSSLL